MIIDNYKQTQSARVDKSGYYRDNGVALSFKFKKFLMPDL